MGAFGLKIPRKSFPRRKRQKGEKVEKVQLSRLSVERKLSWRK
jgi:hypothetical protein